MYASQKVTSLLRHLEIELKTVIIYLRRRWAWQPIFAYTFICVWYIAIFMLNLLFLTLKTAEICALIQTTVQT